jgi:hypothetical protein
MRKVLFFALVIVVSGIAAPMAEAGPFAKIHRAKMNLIKKILHR